MDTQIVAELEESEQRRSGAHGPRWHRSGGAGLWAASFSSKPCRWGPLRSSPGRWTGAAANTAYSDALWAEMTWRETKDSRPGGRPPGGHRPPGAAGSPTSPHPTTEHVSPIDDPHTHRPARRSNAAARDTSAVEPDRGTGAPSSTVANGRCSALARPDRGPRADGVETWSVPTDAPANEISGAVWQAHRCAASLWYEAALSRRWRCRPVSGISARNGRWIVHALAMLPGGGHRDGVETA